MRIVFMGTPGFAVPVLDALVEAGHEVVAAYSQPPRRAGRGKALTPSPVQARAEALGIGVRTPVSLRDPAAQGEFAGWGAEVAVVAAYGLILPRAVLDAPPLGCLNVHASLLPRWRGAAPIQRAILAGDAETGVGIMQMEAGLDTGPVRLEGRTAIGDKTAGELTEELSAIGARLMTQVLADPARYPPVAQPGAGVTHAAKIDKAEARLDFSRGAIAAERQVRAFNPAPGAFFEVAGERIRVLRAVVENSVIPAQAGIHSYSDSDSLESPATMDPRPRGDDEIGVVVDHFGGLAIATADGLLVPTLVQRAGRGAMTPAELLRGFPIPPGMRLT